MLVRFTNFSALNLFSFYQPGEDLEEETPVEEENERPLKRLRLRHQEGQASPSLSNSRAGTSLKRPIGEHDELPETCTVPLMPNSEITRAELRPISPHPVSKNKGKQIDVTVRSVSNSSPRNLRGREKEPPAPQNDPRKKKRISDGSSNAVVLKEPKVGTGLNLFPKQKVPDRALIKPKDEPFTEEMPQLELPITMIHPGLSYLLWLNYVCYSQVAGVLLPGEKKEKKNGQNDNLDTCIIINN